MQCQEIRNIDGTDNEQFCISLTGAQDTTILTKSVMVVSRQVTNTGKPFRHVIHSLTSITLPPVSVSTRLTTC